MSFVLSATVLTIDLLVTVSLITFPAASYSRLVDCVGARQPRQQKRDGDDGEGDDDFFMVSGLLYRGEAPCSFQRSEIPDY